jgi:GNAT superfamily N-acetyltransferase
MNPHSKIPPRGDESHPITVKISPLIAYPELRALFLDAGTLNANVNLEAMLKRALFYVRAFDGVRLVGYAKMIDDGGVHGFLLDPTVSTTHRRRGIGTAVVLACVAEAKQCDIEWLHVDFEPRLEPFYRGCGFVPSYSGVMNLRADSSTEPEVPSA